MITYPKELLGVIITFQELFSRPVFRHAKLILAGAVLAPSERYNQRHGKKHKKLTDWARQMLFQLRHWLPHREIIDELFTIR
jgi:hypothetical protein